MGISSLVISNLAFGGENPFLNIDAEQDFFTLAFWLHGHARILKHAHALTLISSIAVAVISPSPFPLLSFYLTYTSIPQAERTSQPIPNESAETPRLMAAISKKRFANGRSFATEM